MIAGNPNQDGNAAAAAAALTGIFSAPTYKGGRGGGYQASTSHSLILATIYIPSVTFWPEN